MSLKNLRSVFVCLLFVCTIANAQKPALIPEPQSVIWKDGSFAHMDLNSRILLNRRDTLAGVSLNADEAYRLEVRSDTVFIEARTDNGFWNAFQTLDQLTCFDGGKLRISCCEITDWPAFRIRGFMQDVGRNYQSLRMLKEQLEVMGRYKLNVFHWHLTENTAWRLESKRYPQLNDPATMSRWPGKFYTQDEFREIVGFARKRGITVIPEFDIPGHSAAFRKAFGLDSMSDSRVKTILLGLFDELLNCAPDSVMPFIHIGTDEVWSAREHPAPDLLPAIVEFLTARGRIPVTWRPGYRIAGDNVSVKHLFSLAGLPQEGHASLDSRLNYLNHLDPLAGIAQLYFDRICGAAEGDSLKLGGILCCWNDNRVNEEYDILTQNPVYPGLVTYSEITWKGVPEETGDLFLAKLPPKGSPLFNRFGEFEERLIRHRESYFAGKPFPYVRQTGIEWLLLGPFPHGGDPALKFAVEDSLNMAYDFAGKQYTWLGPVYGGTVHISHFFGYPSYFDNTEGTVYAFTQIWSDSSRAVDFWIGFHDWSRSAGRRGGPFPKQGQWHKTEPVVWVNQQSVPPPHWNNPSVPANSEEIPFTDENYFFRKPTQLFLKKGWNTVMLKIPKTRDSWNWMFTFVPVEVTAKGVREVKGIRFRASFN